MATQKNTNSDALLKNLVPLNTLSEEQLGQLLSRIVIEKARKGQYLFREGDSDHQNIYLLSGTVALLSGQKEMDLVSSGTQTARFALAHQLPRKQSARAKSAVTYVRIDSRMLSDMLARSQTASYEVNEDESASKNDWMSLLLHLPVFQQIPPANLQQVMMRMSKISVAADETIIQQGDEGDYFYLISRGTCRVTRQPEADHPPVELAQLNVGQGFGEEALISDKPRSSTVTMMTGGELVRLSKQDFVELVKQPLAHTVEYADACKMIKEGALWVDVRTPEEYDAGHLPDAINLPFYSLRFQASSLTSDHIYLVYGDEVGQSATAAYLLVERGYEVLVISEGWSDLAVLARLNSPVDDSQIKESTKVNQEVDSRQENEESQLEEDNEDNAHTVQTQQKELADAKNYYDEKIAQYQTELKLLKQTLTIAKRKLEVLKEAEKTKEALSKEVGKLQAALADQKDSASQYHAKLDESTEAVNQLKDDLQSAQDARESAENQYREQISTLEQKLLETEKLKVKLDTDKESLHESVTNLQRSLSAEKQENERLTAAYQESTERQARQDDELAGLTGALEQERQRNQELEGSLGSLEDQNGSLERELESLRADGDDADVKHQDQLQTLRSELDEAREAIVESNKAQQQLQIDHDAALSSINSLEQDLAASRSAYSQMQQKMDEAERKHQISLNDIKDQFKASQSEVATVTQDLNSSRADFKELDELRLTLAAKLEQEQQSTDFLKRSLATAEEAIEISDASLNSKDEENDALHKKQAALLAQVEEMDTKIAQETAKNDELEALLVEKSEIEKQLTESQDKLQSAIQRYDEETAQQQQTIERMEQELSNAKTEMQQLSHANEETQAAQQSLQDAQQEISKLQNTITGLREVQLEMETQLSADAEEEIENLRAKLEQAEKKLNKAEEQAKKVDVLRRERDVQETAVEMLGDDLEAIGLEKKQLEEDNKGLVRQLSALRDQVTGLMDENNQLNTQLSENLDKTSNSGVPDDSSAEMDEISAKLARFARERDEARSDSERLQQEVQELRGVIETYVDQIQAAHTKADTTELTALHSELEMVRRQAAEDLERMSKELSAANSKAKAQNGRDIHEAASLQALRQEIDSSRQALHEKEQLLRLSQTQCRTLEDSIEDRDKEVDQLKRKLELLIRKTGGLGEFSEGLDSEMFSSQILPSEDIDQISELLQEMRAVGQSASENDKKGYKLGRFFRSK